MSHKYNFEYRTIDILMTDASHWNELGQDGWELAYVGEPIGTDNGIARRCLLKRKMCD